jgi:hypothetical protein
LPSTAASSLAVTSVNQLSQIKLYDRQLDTHNDPNDEATIVHKQPEIWGYFENEIHQNVNTPQQAGKHADHLEVDPDRWLIICGDHMIQNQNGQCLPAQIYVKIAFSVRNPNTWEPYRYELRQTLNSLLQTEDHLVHREEIFLKVVGQYDNNFNLTGATDNYSSDAINQDATYYATAEQNQFFQVQSFDVPYVGIVPIQPDGLITQVTYSITCGEGGSTLTRASLATEHNDYVEPFASVRKKLEAAAAAKKARRLEAQRGKGECRLGAGFC